MKSNSSRAFGEERFASAIRDSIAVKQAVLDTMAPGVARAAAWMIETLESGGKLVLFGNGGSAADAQHVAAEFVGRFERERRAWPAIALTTDTSILTALGNDYALDIVFSRQIEALGRAGDLAIALSTSGNSPNVIKGAEAARARGMQVVALTGEGGGALGGLADLALCVPSRRTARIQECHITILHALCEIVEATLADTESD